MLIFKPLPVLLYLHPSHEQTGRDLRIDNVPSPWSSGRFLSWTEHLVHRTHHHHQGRHPQTCRSWWHLVRTWHTKQRVESWRTGWVLTWCCWRSCGLGWCWSHSQRRHRGSGSWTSRWKSPALRGSTTWQPARRCYQSSDLWNNLRQTGNCCGLQCHRSEREKLLRTRWNWEQTSLSIWDWWRGSVSDSPRSWELAKLTLTGKTLQATGKNSCFQVKSWWPMVVLVPSIWSTWLSLGYWADCLPGYWDSWVDEMNLD